MTKKDDIHDKTSGFTNNNNIQLLLHNPTDIYNKKIIQLIKKTVKIILDNQKKIVLKRNNKKKI